MAEPLDDGEREVGRRNLEGKALADEPGELGLVVQGVGARDDAAGAVAEQEDGQPGSRDLASRMSAETLAT